MSIEVMLNGLPASFDSPPTVEQLVAMSVASPRGIAVAIDRSVIPRSAWSSTLAHDGVHVEIVSAAAGG